MNIVKSKHASHRCKNRSVPDGILELLEDFGMRKRRAGADVLYFDNKSKKRIKRHYGSSLLGRDNWQNLYAVIADDGGLITVGFRTRRIKAN